MLIKNPKLTLSHRYNKMKSQSLREIVHLLKARKQRIKKSKLKEEWRPSFLEFKINRCRANQCRANRCNNKRIFLVSNNNKIRGRMIKIWKSSKILIILQLISKKVISPLISKKRLEVIIKRKCKYGIFQKKFSHH